MSNSLENNHLKLARDYRERVVVTDSSSEPQLESVIVIPVPDAATGDVDVVVERAFEVTEVVVQKRGGAGAASNTITVKKGATAISDALDMNVADKVLVRASTIDDAQSTLAAGDTLRVSRAKSGGNAQCLVTVRGFLR
jgi:hypothetical protein